MKWRERRGPNYLGSKTAALQPCFVKVATYLTSCQPVAAAQNVFWDLSTSIVWKLDTDVENRVSPRRPMDEDITEWNSALDSSIKPNRRGEDKINESLKQEESEESKGNDQKKQ